MRNLSRCGDVTKWPLGEKSNAFSIHAAASGVRLSRASMCCGVSVALTVVLQAACACGSAESGGFPADCAGGLLCRYM